MTHFPGKRLPSPGGEAGATAEPARRGPVPRNTSGRTGAPGTAFGPRDSHACRPDPAAAVPAPDTRSTGPRKRSGAAPRPRTGTGTTH
ncbi:hypothetical protein J2X68_007165 [Streptomyces sp. 3330]|nr:hypothetical protein [Streptomyces sp. 3330]